MLILWMQHLLLLHGAIGAKDQLQLLADELSDYYIIHTLNFSGHGGEPFTAGDFSIPVFAEDVMAYLEKKQYSPHEYFRLQHGWLCSFISCRAFTSVG